MKNMKNLDSNTSDLLNLSKKDLSLLQNLHGIMTLVTLISSNIEVIALYESLKDNKKMIQTLEELKEVFSINEQNSESVKNAYDSICIVLDFINK